MKNMDSGYAYLGVGDELDSRETTWREHNMDAIIPFFYEILLVDDHALVRQGIRRIIEEKSDLKVVGELQNGLELMEVLKKKQPQMVILDISMPRLGGIEATRMIKAIYPEIKVLILTLHNRREYVNQARLVKADGYLLKDEVDKELLLAIDTLRQGKTYLSSQLGIVT
jgi:two-component system response regulator NreC